VEFNNHFLNCIIFAGIVDTEFLRQIRQNFPLDAFRSPIRMSVASLLYDYVDEFKESPGDHFYDLFYDFIKTVPEKNRRLYDDYIGILRKIDNVNTQYILSKIYQAIRHIRIEEALAECARLVKNKRYDDAESTFLNAIKNPTRKNFLYINYFTEKDSIIDRMSEEPYLMKSMIGAMDDIIGGFRKGETIVWVGTPKAGKTFGLISMAFSALLQGLTVVFISLELHRYRISMRMDQAAGFLVGKKGKQNIMEYSTGSWRKKLKRVDSIFDIDKVMKTRETLARHGGKLIIASAPGNTKNYKDIELFLDELEMSEGIIPHVVCVDYLRNMRGTAREQKRKEKISENCLGLVGIAQQRGCIVHTAQQGNRKAMSAKVLTPDMIADDVDPIGYADVIPTICQTESEEERNEARIYLAAIRESAKGAQIRVVRDLARGQFHLDSELVASEWGKNADND